MKKKNRVSTERARRQNYKFGEKNADKISTQTHSDIPKSSLLKISGCHRNRHWSLSCNVPKSRSISGPRVRQFWENNLNYYIKKISSGNKQKRVRSCEQSMSQTFGCFHSLCSYVFVDNTNQRILGLWEHSHHTLQTFQFEWLQKHRLLMTAKGSQQ